MLPKVLPSTLISVAPSLASKPSPKMKSHHDTHSPSSKSLITCPSLTWRTQLRRQEHPSQTTEEGKNKLLFGIPYQNQKQGTAAQGRGSYQTRQSQYLKQIKGRP